jgi:hypothetical protein
MLLTIGRLTNCALYDRLARTLYLAAPSLNICATNTAQRFNYTITSHADGIALRPPELSSHQQSTLPTRIGFQSARPNPRTTNAIRSRCEVN